MTQDIYCSPTECIPSGAEVKYCLERSFTSLFTPLHFTSLPPFFLSVVDTVSVLQTA